MGRRYLHVTSLDKFFSQFYPEIWKTDYNGSQLKNPDISGATTTLSLSILILNYQCVEGARDVKVF